MANDIIADGISYRGDVLTAGGDHPFGAVADEVVGVGYRGRGDEPTGLMWVIWVNFNERKMVKPPKKQPIFDVFLHVLHVF